MAEKKQSKREMKEKVAQLTQRLAEAQQKDSQIFELQKTLIVTKKENEDLQKTLKEKE